MNKRIPLLVCLVVFGCGGQNPTSDTPNDDDPLSTATCLDFGEPRPLAALANANINEISGLAASRQYTDVLYTHVDSGGVPTVYAFNLAGEPLGQFNLQGVQNVDWEDIAVALGPDGTHTIYVADIGDNAARLGGVARESIRVLRFEEPPINKDGAFGVLDIANVTVIEVQYPGTPHDAESLWVDPVTNALLLLTKENDGTSTLYQAANPAIVEGMITLEAITEIQLPSVDSGGQVVAADIAPLGDVVVARTYQHIWAWPVLGSLVDSFAMPPIEWPSASETKSEGITFTADGSAWLTAGEGTQVVNQGLCVQ